MEYLEGWEAQPAAGPDRSDPPAALEEDRRMKRMISNRESARRSRVRKQRHLEDLRRQLSQHKALNRDLTNRLGAVAQYSILLRCDNDRLLFESASLLRRLAKIRRVLLYRRFQLLNPPAAVAACGGLGSGEEPNFTSLIVNK